MRKYRGLFTVLLLLLCWVNLTLTTLHAESGYMGFGPKQYQDKLNYGEGVYFAPYDIKIYAQPEVTAQLLEDLVWSHGNKTPNVVSLIRKTLVPADQVFLSFYPNLDIAMMSVISDDGNGWAEVIYDQAHNKTGWVQLRKANEPTAGIPSHFKEFQTWQEYMQLNAKTNGIYWLSGVSQYNRALRSHPDDKAKLIEIMYLKDMKVKFIQGNWMLVEALDIGNMAPIGWIRWRDEDGHLRLFTHFSGTDQALSNR